MIKIYVCRLKQIKIEIWKVSFTGELEEIAQTVNLYPAKVGNLIRGKQKNLAFILCVCVCV